MRFGRYIVGLPSVDHDPRYVPSRATEALAQDAEDIESEDDDAQVAESSDADAI